VAAFLNSLARSTAMITFGIGVGAFRARDRRHGSAVVRRPAREEPIPSLQRKCGRRLRRVGTTTSAAFR
jgi:hypothetical protein